MFSVRSWSISPTAPRRPTRVRPTSAIAPWNGRSANDRPPWNSRTYGFAENAMSSSVIASRIVNVIPRRRAWRLARSEVIDGPARVPAAAAISGAGGCTCRRRGPAPSSVRQLLEHDAGAARDAGQRVVGDVDGHLGGLGDAAVEAGEQGTAAGEHDPLVHDVGDELGRRLLDRVLDGVDDLGDRDLDRLADLVRADLDRARQPREQVAAAEGHPLAVPLARVRGPDRDLDVLGRPLAEEQVVLAPGVADDVLSISSPPMRIDRLTTMPPSEDRDLGRAAADVHDQGPGRLATPAARRRSRRPSAPR